jgi:hypothetical protein
MSVDEQGKPDTTTDAQRMAPSASPTVAPAQPSLDTTYASQPLPTPAASNAPAPAAAPAQDANKPHWLARALDGVLKTATGGDVYVTNPDGSRSVAPQSRGTLGKTLIAATLAGLLSKDEYRQTPYGPVRDYSATGANAAAAGKSVVEQMRNKPQQVSDEIQTKKMMTLQNNSQLVALQSAQARLANEKNDYRIKSAAHVDEMFSPFKEYEDLRTGNNDPTQPKAFIDGGRGLSHEEALAMVKQKGNGFTDNNIIQDGWSDKWDDAAQRMVPEPTYAILNPELKDVTLAPGVTDVLNKVNSQYKDIHKIVGGSVKVPVNAYVSAMHDYQAVQTGQVTLDLLSRELGGKGVTLDQVEKAARDGRSSGANILPSLYQLTHAVAGGQTPDKRPDNLLDVILQSPNGDSILKLIGMTPGEASDKKDAINAKRVKELALAKEGGVGDKSPAPQQQIEQTQKALSKLPPDDQEALKGDFNPNGTTVGELKHINDKIQQIRKDNKELAIKQGDPVQLAATANNMIEGDLSSVKDLLTSRQNVRDTFNNVLQQEARRRGLDPTRYTLSAQQARSDMYKDYSGNATKTGAQLTSFGTLLAHVNEGYDASEAWTRSGSPLLNHGIGWLAENAQNDQNFKRFQADIIAPAKEYMSFLNANRAEHEQDIKSLEAVINPATSPAGVLTALKSFAKTADLRAANIGQRYVQTVGTTYPVVNPQGAAVLNRLLGKGQSQAVAVSAPIPRGWQNNQPAQLTDKNVLNTIFQAAGKDPQRATQLARENGWIVPQQ